MDLDHGLQIQNQVQTVGSQLAISGSAHTITGQGGDYEYGLAADVVVGFTIDGDGGQRIAVGIAVIIQEIVCLCLVVGTFCVYRFFVQINIDGVLFAFAIFQSNIEADSAVLQV